MMELIVWLVFSLFYTAPLSPNSDSAVCDHEPESACGDLVESIDDCHYYFSDLPLLPCSLLVTVVASLPLVHPLSEQSLPAAATGLAMVAIPKGRIQIIRFAEPAPPRGELLALKPAPLKILEVLFDGERIALLGERTSPRKAADRHASGRRLHVWWLRCSRRCRLTAQRSLDDSSDVINSELSADIAARIPKLRQLITLESQWDKAQDNYGGCTISSSGCWRGEYEELKRIDQQLEALRPIQQEARLERGSLRLDQTHQRESGINYAVLMRSSPQNQPIGKPIAFEQANCDNCPIEGHVHWLGGCTTTRCLLTSWGAGIKPAACVIELPALTWRRHP